MRSTKLLSRFLSKPSLNKYFSQRVMVTGGNGQIGQVIYKDLIDRFGTSNVLYTDLAETNRFDNFEQLDA